jgi:hypothetical protein
MPYGSSETQKYGFTEGERQRERYRERERETEIEIEKKRVKQIERERGERERGREGKREEDQTFEAIDKGHFVCEAIVILRMCVCVCVGGWVCIHM